MDNNNDLTVKVSGWLRQYGLYPGEPYGDGWIEVYYDGVLFDCKVIDDKVCVTIGLRMPDGDMEARAKAAFELMAEYHSVQIYREEMDDGGGEDELTLRVRVWVHELSNYGRFEREFQYKMDQLVACCLKICGMPVFNGDGDAEVEDDARNECLQERMRQIEAYLKEKGIEYEVTAPSRITFAADEAIRIIVDISDGCMSLFMASCFQKEMRDVLEHAAMRTMGLSVGQWVVQEADDCTDVLYNVWHWYSEEDDEQTFIDKLAYLLTAYLESTDIFDDNLRSHLEEMENASESTAKKEEGADIDTQTDQTDEDVGNRVVTVLREAGYSPTVEDGIHFQWQGRRFLVRYSAGWTDVEIGMYLPKDICDFHALSSYLFEVMSQFRVKLRLEEDWGNDRWAVVICAEIPNSELKGGRLNAHLSDMMELCGTLLEHYGLCVTDEDEEKSTAVCDFVFNCLSEGGYSPECTEEDDTSIIFITYNELSYAVFVSPDGECCTVTHWAVNISRHEFIKEVRAAFSLMSCNTDVTVCRSEPDEGECEEFHLSEMFMLPDDKETFLSDLKSYLEDLERCTDVFVERVKQQ